MQFLGTNLEAANNLKDTVFRLCYRSKRFNQTNQMSIFKIFLASNN